MIKPPPCPENRDRFKDGLWNLLYYDTLLGRFNEHTHTITGALSLKDKC
ncbi:MAG: hypothetical protein HYS40_04055 [Gemmatimonadetes bacterium]|nr:hypothetical protein [Gemmatimonadota bacterium]